MDIVMYDDNPNPPAWAQDLARPRLARHGRKREPDIGPLYSPVQQRMCPTIEVLPHGPMRRDKGLSWSGKKAAEAEA